MWIAGVLLSLIGVALGLVARDMAKQERKVLSAETMSGGYLKELASAASGSVGPGAFRLTCEVVGVARPGPDGVLKSELTSTECVWYRNKQTRRYWETRGGKRVERSERLAERRSNQPFVVDDGTGPVLVHPGAIELQGADKVVDRVESLGAPVGSETQTTIGHKHEEWVLRPGQHLYVFGEASDTGGDVVLVPSVISTKGEQQLLQESRGGRWLTAAVATVTGSTGVVLVLVDLIG